MENTISNTEVSTPKAGTKSFDNLQSLKSHIGIQTLSLNTALTAEGNPTDWLRHWDNDSRIAVSLHKDTAAKLKADPNVAVGLQTETRTAEQGEYTSYRIVIFTPAEMVL